jgi:hypothetical protein
MMESDYSSVPNWLRVGWNWLHILIASSLEAKQKHTESYWFDKIWIEIPNLTGQIFQLGT